MLVNIGRVLAPTGRWQESGFESCVVNMLVTMKRERTKQSLGNPYNVHTNVNIISHSQFILLSLCSCGFVLVMPWYMFCDGDVESKHS